MLKSVVPTPLNVAPGASVLASIAKTRSNWTAGLQSRPS
jgi:hypothetical protein